MRRHTADPAATYRGSRGPQPGATRVVVEAHGQAVLPLRHHVRHSPDGFEWGYGGSGPTELARCLLIDALGTRGHCPTCTGSGRLVWDAATWRGFRERADQGHTSISCYDCRGAAYSDLVERQYHDFRDAHVARWHDTWTITRADVVAWAERNAARIP